MSKYKANGLPWHHGIGVKVTDCKTAREVIEKAELNWTVSKCKIVAKMPFSLNSNNEINEEEGDFARNGNIYRECESAYATYRTDINVPLGLVKSKYEVVQNIEAFNFFDDAIGEDKAIWQSAGYFGVGSKIYITAKLPPMINMPGDPIDEYLVFSNSHDGSCSVNILFTPVRVVCTNMLASALNSNEAYIRYRHTMSVKGNIQSGAEILNACLKHAKHAEEFYKCLQSIKMNDRQVMEYICSLNLTDKEHEALLLYDKENGYKKIISRDYLTMERTGISTRKANQLFNMFEYYLDGIGQKSITGTAWGAYNGVTGFYSNVANLEGEKRMDSLLYGNSARNLVKGLNSALNYRELVG